jgi:hypothetical protein
MIFKENNSKLASKLNEKNFVSKSQLAKPIQNLIQMIFDIEKIMQQMKEFEVFLNIYCLSINFKVIT